VLFSLVLGLVGVSVGLILTPFKSAATLPACARANRLNRPGIAEFAQVNLGLQAIQQQQVRSNQPPPLRK
jgi:hypothetical protein